jgi:hypothetical protein
VQQYAGLVLSKIYFTGSGSTVRDQYFRITNNSDTVIDAQGVVVLESKFNCATAYYGFSDSISDQHFVTGVIYRVPDPTPIAPGDSIVLAYQREDLVPQDGLDLSGADYGWTEGTPTPLLDKIFSYSATVWVLHNRGFASYAIAALPEGVNDTTALNNRGWKYTGTYYLNVNGTVYPYTASKAYKIPNEWIIDAVNVVSSDTSQRLLQTLPYVLDAGETDTGVLPSNSTARFGIAVSRNRGANGKYVDTNNSTNDFAPTNVPEPDQP